jgi:hypothetical protein
LPVVKVRDFSVCMKKIITISSFSLSFLALIAITGSQTACHKDSTTCTAVITVKDSNSNAISGATVKLFAPHTTLAEAEATGTTNASGSVSFTFSLPAILNIEASKALAANDTLKGSGIIQLQIGQSVSAAVTAK